MESDASNINRGVRYWFLVLSTLKIMQLGIYFPFFGKKVKCILDRIVIMLHYVIGL